jgi:quercetin dioxygenase-like cupin family protein
MNYVRVYADQNGDSHFEDVEVALSPTDFAPPAPPIDVSPPMQATAVAFLGFHPGYEGPAHPAPRRQFVFVLTGEAEVDVSDGEMRRVAPGSVVLLEDTWGKGHTTRVVGNGSALAAVVQLSD